MAPRGRSRGVGNTRMDAAIDALKPMGFLPSLIRKKVKGLLEVYGGAEGWAFIEDSSYKVLIDSILEDQEREKCEPGEPSFKDCQMETRAKSVDAEPSEARLLCIADRPSCFEQEAVLLSPETVAEPLCLPPAQDQNYALHENPIKIDMENVRKQIAAILEACEHSTPPGFEHLPREQEQGSAISKPKRRPCLGWIGPKDDDDFVLFEPMPVEGTEDRRRARGKLKSRWDEKPDGIM